MEVNDSSAPARKFVPVMLTPFKENGSIDLYGLSALTDMYLEKGAGGLFANCLSSEMYDLTADEKLIVIKHVVSQTAGAVPVVASGNFGPAIDRQADFVKRVYDCGVDAVILISGLIAPEEASYSEFTDRLLELTDRTSGIRLGVYECPVPYKRLVTPELLGQLAATGRYVYHKDTCLDIAQVKQKIAATHAHAFGVYDAHMVNAVASLRAGVAGLSCIQGNYFPELIVWLCNYYDDPDRVREVDLVQEFLTENMEVVHEMYPRSAKYYLWKRGFPINTMVRQDNGVELSKDKQDDLNRLYINYELLLGKLGIPVAV